MFPLGSVLLPHMPLQLQVFEPRYAVMLDELLRAGTPEFGVVLIERGQEVGGGEQRFSVGTVAEITDLKAAEGLVLLAARGTRRITVTSWLPEDPYPRAEVSDLPELTWTPELEPLRQRTEQLVRRTLAVASEFEEATWPPDVTLADDPIVRSWQLAGIAPLTALDQVRLLRVESAKQLLTEVLEQTGAAAATITATWPQTSEE